MCALAATPAPRVLPLLNPDVVAQRDELGQRFARREPFRHVVIDAFLEPAYARELLAQFPPFERGNAVNEAGERGRKAVVEKIRALGPAFGQLDDMVRSREFLDLVGHVTAIPGLLYDPYYFGGGTHENREGQDLDPHVDFNRHPVERWHRRLNLIVYLNPEWRDEWGGSLELHSDPRGADDRVELVTPTFNRCVIFETTEHSWHGFSRIAPPSREISRRSIAMYFYSHERPVEELADTHSTIYVDRQLPAHLLAGHVLSEDDLEQVRVLLTRRDEHAQRLYRDLEALQRELDISRAALNGGPLGRLVHFGRRALARLSRRGS